MSTAIPTPSWKLPKLPVGIPGFEDISDGGLPKGRTTLVSGSAGSGKTLFAIQFLVSGVRRFGEGGVLVTFEEKPEDLVRNVKSFGWGLDREIAEGRIAVVDASPEPGVLVVESGAFDLSGLMARIEDAIRRVKARRVVLDSLGATFSHFVNPSIVRQEMVRIVTGLRQMECTALITAEREQEYGSVSRYSVEEFVADNVIVLRNQLEQEKRRRTIEILKFRGTSHRGGEFPFTIDPHDGVTIVPLSSMSLTRQSAGTRLSLGVPELDKMAQGGVFRDSIVLVSGATGAGKTLLTTEFMKAGIAAGGRSLLFGFEESREQLIRNASLWGVDYEDAEKNGLLKIVCRYPESMGLEDHLIHMKRDIHAFQPDRVAVDSMSALERASSHRSFREFVIGVTSFLKEMQVAGMFTNTTAIAAGAESVTEHHISTITDAIIVLRYVEVLGEMRRGLTILKMRGSWHDKNIREYRIDETGMQIGGPFRGVSGILLGQPTYSFVGEKQSFDDMFQMD